MRRYFILILSLIALVPPASARANDDARQHELYWYGSLGDFKGDETPGKLEGQGSSYGLVVGFGTRYRRYLNLEGELAWYTSKYDTPPLTPPFLGSIDARMRLSSAGFAGNAKLVYDLPQGMLYAGGGIGIYWSDLVVTGTIIGLDASRTETDTNLGYHFLAGGEINISERSRLGLEYRRLKLQGNFSDLSNGTVDIGGRYVAITFRQTFQIPKP